MSLAERVKQPPQAVTRCSIGKLLATLPDAEREALQLMLDSPDWSDPATHEALLAEGHDSRPKQIGPHRRGECGCPR